MSMMFWILTQAYVAAHVFVLAGLSATGWSWACLSY